MDIDDVDRRILHALARDARHTSAPDIAAELDVSAATVRNRIRRLEEGGVVDGYPAQVDYEAADGLLTNLFMCSTGVEDRERLARQALAVPGVVSVRQVMTGREDLRVKAVGTDTEDLTRIARSLSELGIDIEDEGLVETEYFQPYADYGPDEPGDRHPLSGFRTLEGGAEVAEVRVDGEAPIAGRTVEAAGEAGLLGDGVVVVAIERDDEIIAPSGPTTVESGDLVTLFARDGVTDELLSAFN